MKYGIKYIKKGGALATSKDNNYNYKEEYKNGKPNLDNPTIGIVLNGSYGGFDLSVYAKEKLGISDDVSVDEIDRFNPALVRLVVAEGENNGVNNINNDYSSLYVKYLPSIYYEGPHIDDIYKQKKYYRIDEYDGSETLKLNHEKYEIDQKNIVLERREDDLIRLLSMMNEIIFNQNPELTSEKKIEKLKFFFPPGELDINKLIENLDYIPGIGSAFLEAKANFTEKND
jgi:hypothetical protein